MDECGRDRWDQPYAGKNNRGSDENKAAQHVLIDDAQRLVRQRKKMRDKVQAMSSEAKASAAIIGSLPLFVMGALFFPMTGLKTFGAVLLYIGLAMALTATVLYMRSGARQLRDRSRSKSSG